MSSPCSRCGMHLRENCPIPKDEEHLCGMAKPDTIGKSLEYWKERALTAEAKFRELAGEHFGVQRELARRAKQQSDDSWALSNYREEAQRRRDAEIGDMGGGG